MKNKYTLNIGEVAEILQVPKSTLRFWEEKGLIQSIRNYTNDYREYSFEILFEICDVLLLRSLGMPVKELHHFQDMKVEEMEEKVKLAGANLDRQIIELRNKKQKVAAYMQRISELKEMLAFPYRISKPPMSHIIPVSGINQASIGDYLDDPSMSCVVVADPERPVILHGLAVSAEHRESELLWSLPEIPEAYLECPVRISLNEPDDNNLAEIYRHAFEMGYKPGKLVGRFIMTVYRAHNDYFKGWLELL